MAFQAGSVTAIFKADTAKFVQDIKKATAEVTKSLDAVKAGSKSMSKEATSGMASFSKSISGIAKNVMPDLKSSLVKVQDQMKTMAKVGVLGLVGALGFGAKSAMDFEKTMNSLKAVSGATGKAFDDLRNQAKELGKTTKFSATEAAQGQTFLAMAGFNTTEILKSMPSVLDLAAAGNLDLARASDIASNIMGQFGIQAEDTARVTNVLAATASSSNTNIEQLSEAMKYLGPSAKALGIQIEDTAAIIGVLGDAGIQGSLAGRALGSSLVRLADPTDKMSGAMEAMNLQAFDAQGNFVGMKSLLAQVEKGTASMTQEQKAANLYSLLGAEAFQEINILLERGSEAYGQYAESITGTNKAQEMALIQQQGFAGALTVLRSAFESMMISLFDLNVSGKSLLQWMAIGTIRVAEFIRNIDFEAIKQAVKPTFELAKANKNLIIGLTAGVATVTALTFAVAGLGLVIGFLTSPVTLIVAGITALVAGFVYLWRTNEGLRNNLISTWNGIQAAFSTAKEVISPVIDLLGKRFNSEVRPALESVKQSFSGLLSSLKPLLPVLQAISMFVGSVLVVSIIFAVNLIITKFRGLINLVSGVMSILGGVITFFTGVFTGDFEKMGEGIKMVWSGLVQAVIGVLQFMFGWVVSIWNTIVQVFSMFGINIVAILQNLWEAFLLGAQIAGAGVASSIGSALSWVVALMQGAWNAVTSFWGLISSAFASAFSFIGNIVHTFWSFVMNIWNTALAWINLSTSEKLNSIGYLVGWLVGATINNLTNLWNTAKNLFSMLWNWGEKVTMDFIVWAVFSIWQFKNDVVSAFETLGKNIMSFLGDALNWVINAFVQLPGQIWNLLVYIVKVASDAFESLKNNVIKHIVNLGVNLVEFFYNLPGMIWGGLVSLGSMIGDQFTKIKDNVIKTVKKIGDIDLQQAGKDIMEGLKKGIKSKLEDLKNTVKNIGSNIQKGFKDAMGIQSPSKKMKILGQFTADGITEGIKEKMPELEAMSIKMASIPLKHVPAEGMQKNTAENNTTKTMNMTNNNNFNFAKMADPEALVNKVVKKLARSNRLANNGVNV